MKRPCLVLLAPILLAAPAAAQRPAEATDSTAAPMARVRPDHASACESGPIEHVFIDNHSIFDVTDPALADRIGWAQKAANALHVRTRRDVIRRELLFGEGDCLDRMLLADSERLLRKLGFLSRVDIFPVRQPDGKVHVVVDTQDEWSTQLDVRARWDGGPDFEGAALRETNLLGTGRSIGVFFFERDVRRDYGGSIYMPQLAGTRWDLGVTGGRTRAGGFVSQVLAYPFVGEAGRWAARQSYTRRDRYFDYVVGDSPPGERHLLVPYEEEAWDVTGLVRRGRPGRLTVLGGALALQRLAFPGGLDATRLTHGDDFGEREPAPAELAARVADRMRPLNSLRLYLLLGRRNIRWVQRQGVDTFRGEQDVRLGVQAGVAVGRSIPLDDRDDDVFTAISAYAGTENGRTLAAARLRIDARHDLDAPDAEGPWEDVFAEAEWFTYWRPRALPDHTLLFRATGVGGWNADIPFQLTLGGRGARGVRGYAPERFPGGRRLVASVEDRVYFGWPSPDVLDLGGTAFVDVGRVWPGDAAFGVDSGWRAAAGLGLRGSFPAGSRTVYRIDLAAPVRHGLSWRDLRLIISIGESHGVGASFGDPQITRSRRDGVSAGLFHFPN